MAIKGHENEGQRVGYSGGDQGEKERSCQLLKRKESKTDREKEKERRSKKEKKFFLVCVFVSFLSFPILNLVKEIQCVHDT